MITPIAKYRGRFNFLYLYLLVNCHHKKKDIIDLGVTY
jgi:hypothetical protein